MINPSRPPPPKAIAQEWFSEAPTEPGFYWFFGEQYMGSMGGHLSGSIKPDIDLHLVKAMQIGNGLLFVTGGSTMRANRFDREKQREGWLGVWAPAHVPDTSGLTPQDFG